MLATERAQVMLAEAWAFYGEAIKLLERGDLRNAAGKAWEASEKATNAMIVERTGREPQNERETSREVRFLILEGEDFKAFSSRFAGHIHDLYGDCFIDNHCEPEDYHEEMIRNTDGFIREAERLAG